MRKFDVNQSLTLFKRFCGDVQLWLSHPLTNVESLIREANANLEPLVVDLGEGMVKVNIMS